MVASSHTTASGGSPAPSSPGNGRRTAILHSLIWTAVLWAGLLSAACLRREPPPSPLARFEPAVKPAARQELTTLTHLPRYQITVNVNMDENQLEGQLWLELTNTSPDPWPFLVFRLYPMLKQYGGEVGVRSVLYNDGPVAFTFDAGGTALRLPLPSPLRAGEQARVGINWSMVFPTWPDSTSIYALFGRSQSMISLPLFYPSLAVYQPGPTVSTGRWWMDSGTGRGDAAFNYPAFFAVTATLPAAQVPVASGIAITRTDLGDGRAVHQWVAGPVREFVIHTSDRFQQASVEVDGVTVSSYWLPDQAAAGQAALRYATSALRVFSQEFGEYPYTTMGVAVAPLTYRGMEYPNVHLLGVESYSRTRNELEFLTVHEVAHQWWFQLVHNDPVRSPWIDEGLAEYSVKLYYEALYGVDVAARIQDRRWETPVETLQTREADAPLGLAVMDYADATQYEVVVYAKGALFFDEIRRRLGDRKFREWIRQYAADFRFRQVTQDDLLSHLRSVDPSLTEAELARWFEVPSTP